MELFVRGGTSGVVGRVLDSQSKDGTLVQVHLSAVNLDNFIRLPLHDTCARVIKRSIIK